MKKKWIFITGVMLFAIWLTACSNQGEVSPKEPNNDSNASVDDENIYDLDETHNNDTDLEEYNVENDIDIHEDAAITALVNKQVSLDESYAPDDLVTVEVPTVLENPEVNQLRKEAADALKEMFDKAAESDIYLYARSGYRSYQTQVHLFHNYAEQHGEEAANKYSARPGMSEHQTGLAMDVTSESVDFQLTEKFGETEEGQWIKDHAHEFGFIIRYPENMEHITGYIYEPWHLRYLGVDLATNIKEANMTYEEYLVKVGIMDEIDTKG